MTIAAEKDIYLSKCQVDTPLDVVEKMWGIVSNYRENVGKVVDFGAGDGRFSLYGDYESYIGYEVDRSRISKLRLSDSARVRQTCAFEVKKGKYDICIGNPPYVRHHDIDPCWQKYVISKLETESSIKIDARANAFTLFMLKALMTTKSDGLVCLLVPYEWVSRPACEWLRKYISGNQWRVEIYKFKEKLFPRVLTTASIVVIDKGSISKKWKYFEIDRNFNKKKMRLPTGSRYNVIAYTDRGNQNYAQRGLSPGGQKVFCLTEGERQHHGLIPEVDVVPCITSMKDIPDSLLTLDESEFKRCYVDMGRRCWLIKPDPKPSETLLGYLSRVPKELRDNYTCNRQSPWWAYKPHAIPDILYSSGFVSWGPRIVNNEIGAVAVGAVHGIHKVVDVDHSALVGEIKKINFESKIVHHSGSLRKVEVNQMNTIIASLIERINNGQTKKRDSNISH